MSCRPNLTSVSAFFLIILCWACSGAQQLTLEELDARMTEAQNLATQQTSESQIQALKLYQKLDEDLMGIVETFLKQPPSEERRRSLASLSRYRMNAVTGQSLIYSNLGEPGKAIAVLKELLVFLEEHGDPMSIGVTSKSLGDVYRTYSQPAEAWEYYKSALEALPDDEEHRVLLQFARLGAFQALEALGDTEEALKLLNLVEASAEDFEEQRMREKMLQYAYFNRGYFFLRRGRSLEAKVDLEALLALPLVQNDPIERFRASISLISLSRRMADLEGSRQYLATAEKALEESDPSAVTAANLGLFLLSKGTLDVLDGRLPEGLQALDEADELHRQAGLSGLSTAFHVKFTTLRSLGRAAELMPQVEAYLPTIEEPTKSDLELTLMYCQVLAESGQPDEALSRLEALVSVLEDREATASLLEALITIGDIYDSFQVDDKADAYYRQALQLARELDSRDKVLTIQTNIFRTKLRQPYYLNSDELIRKDFEELAEAYRDAGDPGALSVLLTGYFRELVDNYKFEEARLLLEGMKETVVGVSPVVDAFVLHGESLVARKTRQFSQGEVMIERLSRHAADEKTLRRQLLLEVLNWKTLLGMDLSDDPTLVEFDRLSEGVRRPEERIYYYEARAKIAQDMGLTEEAFQLLSQAETLIWAVRDSSSSSEFRSALHERAQRVFGNIAELQIEEKRLKEAFMTAERARGQTLGALFSLGDRRYVSSASPEQKKKLTKLYAQRDELERTQINGEGSAERTLSELEKTVSEIDQLLSQIAFDQTGSLASRISRVVVEPEELKAAMSPEQVMLYYFVAENKSFLFVIAPNKDLEVRTLPDGFELIELVKELRLSVQRGESSKELAAKVGEVILGGLDLSGFREVIVVPDGPLYLLPFSMVETGVGPLSRFQPSVLPSASVLIELQKRQSSESTEITVLADPVYDDEAKSSVNLRASLHTSLLSRLPGTAREARIVKEAASSSGYQVHLHTREHASREELFEMSDSGELRNSRILHFATHGYFAANDARMSGLVLSTVDENGKQINGYLRLVDIYKLNLKADLVVLSACQTGLGSIREGEGLQGLYQGFIMAGSRTVLNTLWSVDDEGTAAFMKFFYTSLMDGSSPKKALSDAQQSMAATPTWSEPFYWAGFQLVSP
jgi:CHAT domain-containing protein/tetratricopeptide (TPR) repeat protein